MIRGFPQHGAGISQGLIRVTTEGNRSLTWVVVKGTIEYGALIAALIVLTIALEKSLPGAQSSHGTRHQ